MTDESRLVRLSPKVAAAVRDIPAVAAAAADLLTVRPARLRALARTDRDAFHAAFSSWARRAVRRLRIDLRVVGAHHARPDRPYVVVALHEGMLDPVVLASLGWRLRFSARDELLGWRSLGRFLTDTDQIVLPDDRQVAAVRVLLTEGTAALAAGESVVVFPQGSILGIETAFLSGAQALARRAEVELLPVVICGTHRVWEYPYSPRVRLGGPVWLEVLPPRPAAEWAELSESMKQAAMRNPHAPVRHFDPDRDGWWDGYRYEIDPAFPALAERVAAHRLTRDRPPPPPSGTTPPATAPFRGR